MATREYIENRIAGKEKEIAKLIKKMDRIVKAQSTNWEVNPYFYDEYDLNRTAKEIVNAKESLDQYKADLKAFDEKASSRNVKAIIDFLESWKANVRSFYTEMFTDYLEERKEYDEKDNEYCEWCNHNSYKARQENQEEYKRVRQEWDEYEEIFRAKWKFLTPYISKRALNMDKLNKELDQEASAKYDFIVERTNSIVGQITDASGLQTGAKGDLNGYIIGTNGTAKVQTIGAGGYNIQCYHFRTLINKA